MTRMTADRRRHARSPRFDIARQGTDETVFFYVRPA